MIVNNHELVPRLTSCSIVRKGENWCARKFNVLQFYTSKGHIMFGQTSQFLNTCTKISNFPMFEQSGLHWVQGCTESLSHEVTNDVTDIAFSQTHVKSCIHGKDLKPKNSTKNVRNEFQLLYCQTFVKPIGKIL